MTDLLKFEKELFQKGIKYIAGVDEVGRGPLAGPFVVGCVVADIGKILNRINDVGSLYIKINDSKAISENKRLLLNAFIRSEFISYSIVEVSSHKLDEIGLSEATQQLFFSAIGKCDIKPEHILTDTFEIKKIRREDQTNIKHGDSLSICVAAASIIAKVYRDRVMTEMHDVYPVYGFDKHKGYGTKEHLIALEKFGPCEIHRRSFSPVKQYFNQ